jgi:hypothetical protein
MSYEVKILADSVASGVRLTTVQATYPRIIHSEVMTHRVLSRNAASSRAIPVSKSIERVLADPFIPEAFAANVRGMQGGAELDEEGQRLARANWKIGLDAAVKAAEGLAALGTHKHWANRLLEPYSWITTVITATEWDNFFALRCHPMAAPEFQKIAGMMRDAMAASEPIERGPGSWHLPFVGYEGGVREDYDVSDVMTLVKLSVARCARVSYLTHDGKRDVDADLSLYAKLTSASPPHLSPCEHAARVATDDDVERFSRWVPLLGLPAFYGNFRKPWIQHRKDLENEQVFRG